MSLTDHPLPLVDQAATEALARRVAACARCGDVVALWGDLGQGKTVFARAFIQALFGPEQEVPSPTFTLVQSYGEVGDAALPVFHFDLYRLNHSDEVWELGWEDACAEGVVVVEWPDRLGSLLPENRLDVSLEAGDGDDARTVTLRGGGDWPQRLSSPRSREDVLDTFQAAYGWGDARRQPLADDASFRRYFRLIRDAESGVLMDAPPPREQVAPFISVAEHLLKLGFSAPQVLAEDRANGLLLLEDLGDHTFSRMLEGGGDADLLYGAAVDVLAALHQLPPETALPSDLPAYDMTKLLDEALLLTDWFLPAMTGHDLDWAAREDYQRAWRHVLARLDGDPATLVLRDYHVDNLMWLPERTGVARVGLLDFQDALAGHPAYDLVSLLEDARRDVDEDLAKRLMARYHQQGGGNAPGGRSDDDFATACAILGGQRHAKVIGIFTRLWRRDNKPQYLGHIPRVWRLLARACQHPAMAPVAAWLDIHVPQPLRRSPPCPTVP